MKGKHVLSALALVPALLGSACGRGPSDTTFEATDQAKRYPLTGVVRDSDPKARQVTVAHEAIPGLMDAMTMSFAVKDTWVTGVAQAGDRLTATLVLDGARSWIEGVSLTKPPEGTPTSAGANAADPVGPAAGTPLPTAALRDQGGRVVRASDFAGRDVIVTFIYTNCPLPDYCPRMMQRLNDAASRLRKADRRDEVQMLAITIDPARDTPAVLTEYGRRHITGEDGDPFRRWSLLTGEPEAIKAWASFFALTYEPDGTEIVHGLRTAVADREGRVVGVLRGNDWTTDDLMALLPARQ